ncbi:hypothetical protein [Lysinibacillus sp. Bpr_S20]|uniref:hypothetical protein n=1 Tax=Lysinibacillus sp. Bpr_S20 TaxID=2933964 RepID=UPI0020110A54|nr:hypothetical protein [Lysinibacillus sp. Bpr_S20]MCL1698806.1 hypothetical protein [Lysinibacillus sp. Bpr_S20]
MNFKNFFVNEEKEFDELKKLIYSTFHFGRTFPEQVFEEEYKHFKFEEFDWTMSDEFWTTLKKLATKSKDDFVLVAVLEPNPEEYFYKEFQYYNWIKMPVWIDEDDYYDILEFGPKESPADAVLYNSSVMIWLSPSLEWAIWGEREFGVCVIAFNDTAVENKLIPDLITWHTLDDTVLAWIEMNFRNQRLYQKNIQALKINYTDNK